MCVVFVCVFCLHFFLTLHKTRLSNIVANSFTVSQELSIGSVCVHSVMASNQSWLGEFQQWIRERLCVQRSKLK